LKSKDQCIEIENNEDLSSLIKKASLTGKNHSVFKCFSLFELTKIY